MKCPCCNKNMKKGYVRAIARGGICWVDEKNNLSAPRDVSGFLQLGKAAWLTAEHVPAFNCDSCELIIIDYSSQK